MENTYTHTTSSGLEVELKRMKSYHQEWLTQGRGSSRSTKTKTNKSQKNIDDVAADIVVSIDGDKAITLDKIQSLPSWEFKEIMLVARFYSCDIHFAERMDEHSKYLELVKGVELALKYKEGELTEADLTKMDVSINYIESLTDYEEVPLFESTLPDHLFKFTWEWKDGDVSDKHLFEIPIGLWDFDMVPGKALYKFEELHDKGSSVKKNRLTLPISKKLIEWSILDVNLENRFKGGLNMETMHINTPISWRNPVELVKKETGEGYIPIQLNLSKMEILDIEELRHDIHTKEGKIDTVLTLNHPAKDELIKVDIFQVVSFFIPSGVV